MKGAHSSSVDFKATETEEEEGSLPGAQRYFGAYLAFLVRCPFRCCDGSIRSRPWGISVRSDFIFRMKEWLIMMSKLSSLVKKITFAPIAFVYAMLDNELLY